MKIFHLNQNPWGPLFPCGTMATRILQDSAGNLFAVETKLPCDRWDCPECGPRMVAKHVDRAKYHFTRVVVYVGTVLLTKEKLPYFLRRNIRKPYMSIRMKAETVIISGSTFPESQGIDKRKFLKDKLPVILGEIRSGRSVSYSRDRKRPLLGKHDEERYRCLALLQGNRAAAFNSLNSSNKIKRDFEHARFLQESQSDGKIYPLGKELINSLSKLEMEIERKAIQSEDDPTLVDLSFDVVKIERGL